MGYGHLMELGPCRIAPEGGYTVDNPFGWNANATLLFVESVNAENNDLFLLTPLSTQVNQSVLVILAESMARKVSTMLPQPWTNSFVNS